MVWLPFENNYIPGFAFQSPNISRRIIPERIMLTRRIKVHPTRSKTGQALENSQCLTFMQRSVHQNRIPVNTQLKIVFSVELICRKN